MLLLLLWSFFCIQIQFDAINSVNQFLCLVRNIVICFIFYNTLRFYLQQRRDHLISHVSQFYFCIRTNALILNFRINLIGWIISHKLLIVFLFLYVNNLRIDLNGKILFCFFIMLIVVNLNSLCFLSLLNRLTVNGLNCIGLIYLDNSLLIKVCL